MKRTCSFFILLLCILILLSGCVSQSERNVSAAASDLQNQNNPGLNLLFENSQKKDNTEKTVELDVVSDGIAQKVKAHVFVGTRYTITIPESWSRNDNAPQWVPKNDTGVQFTIRFYNGKKSEDALDLLTSTVKTYTFDTSEKISLQDNKDVTMVHGVRWIEEEGKSDNVSAKDQEHNGSTLESNQKERRLTAYLLNMERGTYALLLECDEDKESTYGGYLESIAQSFTLKKTGST